MSDLYGVGTPSTDDVYVILPNGHNFLLSRPYTENEKRGVMVLVIVSCLSATAVVGLLLALAISAFNTRKSKSQNLFVRSHVAAYFISLLLCEVAQTVGSIMSIRWVTLSAVSYEPYCTVQGVVKHIADVGTAYWSTIIAINTFWILFLQWKLRRYVLLSALLGGWATIGAIITTGPGVLQKVETGPFYGISGYWCWISDDFPTERVTLDYMVMFISAGLCFIMYTLVFLKLRGNILVHGWRLTFRMRPTSSGLAAKSVDTHVINVAKGMLLYPVAYTILLVPIAVCRFVEWSGHEVPFAVTIFSDSIFLLSGFVNVVLFFTTRRVLPIHSVVPRSVSRLLRGHSAAMSVDTRASSYSASSYPTSGSSFVSDTDVDVEKARIQSYDDMVLPRPDGPLSALASAVPTPYTRPSPAFVIGSARSEDGTYHHVSLDSARMPQVPERRHSADSDGDGDRRSSEEPNIDISSARYSHDADSVRVHPVDYDDDDEATSPGAFPRPPTFSHGRSRSVSPTIEVDIPSSTLGTVLPATKSRAVDPSKER